MHALRNLTSKLPERLHAEVKARCGQILAASAGEAKAGLLALAADYERSYPSAAKVITDNIDQLVAHLRFPLCHRKRTRSTNLLERTFVEIRRRTKVVGRFPGETLGPIADLGRARAIQSRLARGRDDTQVVMAGFATRGR